MIRVTLPVLLTSVIGFLLVAAFFFRGLDRVNSDLSEYFNIIAAVADPDPAVVPLMSQ
jgi:hypothetical protein